MHSIIILYLVLVNVFCFSLIIFPQQDTSKLSPFEKQIIQDLSKSSILNMTRYVALGNNLLNSEILKNLFTNKYRLEIPNKEIIIRNAIFNQPITIRNEEFTIELIFENCKFLEVIDLSGNTFRQDFIFNIVEFYKGLRITNTKFLKNIIIRKSEITGLIDFGHTSIEGAMEITNTKFNSYIKFNNIKVGNSCNLNRNIFSEKLNITYAKISGSFESKSSLFYNEFSLNGSDIGENIFLDSSKFHQYVDLKCRVGNQLVAENIECMAKVNLNGAKVNGPVILNYSVFNSNIDLRYLKAEALYSIYCQFKIGFFLSGSKFDNEIDLSGSKFNENGGNLTIHNTTANALVFSNAKFFEEVSFLNLDIHTYVSFLGAIFYKAVDCNNLNLMGRLILDYCAFHNNFNLKDSNLNGGIRIYDAIFNNDISISTTNIKLDAQFNKVNFKGNVEIYRFLLENLLFLNCIFYKEIIVTTGEIKGVFDITKSELNDFKINNIKTGATVQLSDNSFNGSFSIIGLNSGGQLNLSKVKFNKLNSPILIFSTETKDDILLNNSEFLSEIKLEQINTTGRIILSSSMLIEGIKCKNLSARNILLDNVYIKSYGSFNSINLENDFSFQLTGIDSMLEIINSTISGTLLFEKARLDDSILISNSQFSEINFQNNVGNPKFVLNRSTIYNNYILYNNNFTDYYLYTSVVNGNFGLKNNTFLNKFSLLDCDFFSINLIDNDFKSPKDSVRLKNISFRQISVGDKAGEWNKLKKLISKAKYNSDLYVNLEQYFRNSGLDNIADEIYIEKVNREKETENSIFTDIGGILYYITIGYGKHPEWAFVWSIIFITVGTIVFSPKKMTEISNNKMHYSRFGYSLDLFLPVVDLNYKNNWIPSQDRWFIRKYEKVHRLLGWVLITLGIVSITGLVG